LNKAALDAGLPNHQTVGSRLAEKWRFPMPLRIAINYQRYLADTSRATLARNMGMFVDITAMADIMVRRYKFGDPGDDVLPEVDDTLMERMRIKEEDFDVFEEKMHEATQRSKIVLELASEAS
jgi:HD-like signal output (HDOD) protein